MGSRLIIKPEFNTGLWRSMDLEMHLKGVREIWDRYDGSIPKIVIDIGAHIGTFGLTMARNGAKFVYCIEPNTDNYKALTDAIEFNKAAGKVAALKMAVYDESFKVKNLFTFKYNSGQRSLEYPYSGPGTGSEKVWTISLEDLLLPVINTFGRVDFLKMDIEGAEYNTLSKRSSLTEALKKVKYVDIECHVPVKGEYIAVQDVVPEESIAIKDYLIEIGFDLKSYGPHHHLYGFNNQKE